MTRAATKKPVQPVREAWVYAGTDTAAGHVIIEVDDDGTAHVSHADWVALATMAGLSQSSHLPDDPEPFDPETMPRVVTSSGNQRYDQPNQTLADPDDPDTTETLPLDQTDKHEED